MYGVRQAWEAGESRPDLQRMPPAIFEAGQFGWSKPKTKHAARKGQFDGLNSGHGDVLAVWLLVGI